MLTTLYNSLVEDMIHYVSSYFLDKNPYDFISFSFQPKFFLEAEDIEDNKTDMVTAFKEFIL